MSLQLFSCVWVFVWKWKKKKLEFIPKDRMRRVYWLRFVKAVFKVGPFLACSLFMNLCSLKTLLCPQVFIDFCPHTLQTVISSGLHTHCPKVVAQKPSEQSEIIIPRRRAGRYWIIINDLQGLFLSAYCFLPVPPLNTVKISDGNNPVHLVCLQLLVSIVTSPAHCTALAHTWSRKKMQLVLFNWEIWTPGNTQVH